MKKTKWLSLFLLIISFCCLAFFGNSDLKLTASAASNSEVKDINTTNYADTYDFDDTLWRVVRELAKQFNPNSDGTGLNPVSGFNVNLFSEEYKTANVLDGGAEKSDGQKLKEDLTNGVLNLTTGKNARYSCLVNRSQIKDITGLNSLALSNIKTLILNDNAITSIKADQLETLNNLRVLRVENNGLTSVKLNPDVTTINELYFANNNLTALDMSNLAIYNTIKPGVDLSNNQISEINGFVYPTSGLSKFDLSFNNLRDLSETELNTLNSKMSGGAKVDILLQGIKNLDSLKAGETISIYQSDKINKLSVAISYSPESSLYVESGENLICQTEGNNDVETISIPAGKVTIEFFSNGTLINKTNFPTLSTNLLEKLSSKNCNIALTAPTFVAYVNGEEVESLDQETDIKVVFGVENASNIPNITDILNSSVIYSQTVTKTSTYSAVNNQLINKNGDYTCKAYIHFDGINSEEISVDLTRKDMSGITLGIVIIVIIFVVCAAGVYLVKWIREGASIAPLSDKEIYNLNRRKAKKMGENREDFIADLDKPRYETSVTEKGYNDNEKDFIENLNEEPKNYNIDYKNVKLDKNDMPEDI